jgi:hypothetical protein
VVGHLIAAVGWITDRLEAHSQAMELIISKIIGFLIAVCTAAVVALMVGEIAHYGLGFSRLHIQMSALIGAASVVPLVLTLLTIEYFEKNLRKPR